MAKHGKKYLAAAKLIDVNKRYSVDEAVGLVRKTAEINKKKFDETVDVAIRLGVDPKHADQMVRGAVVLPHGIGKSVRVAVFAKGDKAREATDAGADVVGAEDLAAKVQEGWMDFDVAIATPDMMRDVSKLGKILGPRGMMPNPRTGTVTDDVAKAIKEVKLGKVEFKMDKTSNIHFVIGKRSFEPQKLVDNGKVALDAIVRARPATLKGKMLRTLSLSSTMSPGIALKTEGLEGDLSGEE